MQQLITLNVAYEELSVRDCCTVLLTAEQGVD